MPSIQVRMPYLPNLTSNHAYRRNRDGRPYLRSEARDWRAILARNVREAINGRLLPNNLIVRSDWYSPKEPDQDGRMKLVLDSVQIATGINDRYFVIEHGTWQQASGDDASIVVKISWDEG